MATALSPIVNSVTYRPRPWLHAWAVLTAVCTLPLLVLGAEVTTKGVGMVDRQGLREPWHLVTLWLEGEPLSLGFIIEHSHRTVGWLVGICVLVLTASLWWFEPRRWVRWAGLAALAGVCVQGVLGVMRVNLNALLGSTLSLVHGCFAQLVFALLVSIAVWTSRAWLTAQPEPASAGQMKLRRFALLVVFLLYAQIVLGALVRHKDFAWGARAHLLMAFAVVAALSWLAKLVYSDSARDKPAARCMSVLLVLLTTQLWLGIESWLSKFAGTGPMMRQVEPLEVHQELARSLHYLTGALLFSTAVTLALLTRRSACAASRTSSARPPVENAA